MSRALLVAAVLLAPLAACRSHAGAPKSGDVAETRPVVTVEGKRWVVEHEAAVAPLKPDVRLMGLLAWDARFMCPRSETYFVRAADGSIAPVHHAADLLPFVQPITTPEAALDYATFLRLFEFPQSEVPGMPSGSPERGGLIASMMEADLKAEGIDPTPKVTSTTQGFEIVRLTVMRNAAGTATLVRLREQVGTHGAFTAEVVETLREGGVVNNWIFMAC